jgi:hypothetical protein
VPAHELVEVAIANPEREFSGVINRPQRDAAFDFSADRTELRNESRSTFEAAGFRTVHSAASQSDMISSVKIASLHRTSF